MERSITDCNIRQIEGEGNERKFELSFSSEKPYMRYFGNEILSHADGAVDLTRLNSIGVVLFNHNRDVIVGKVLKAWVEDNRGHAQIEFDTDDEAEKIYQKVLNKTLRGVSVGYNISVIENVQDGAVSSGVGRAYETEGVSSFYYNERQLQINENLILTGGKGL